MKKSPDVDEVLARLADGEIIPLGEKQWLKMESRFSTLENIETGMSGKIQLVKRPVPGKKRPGWAFVEEPEPGKRVIRPFKNEKEARALIQDRLAAYERMWDG